MKLLPGRTLLLALLAPLLLGLTAIAEPGLVSAMLAVDGAIALVALLELLFVLRPAVEAQREAPETVSLARALTVTLELTNRARRGLRVEVNDAVFAHAEVEGLPLRLELAAGGRGTATYRVKPMRRGQQVIGDTWVRYPSPLGFWQRQLRLPGETRLRVYPDVQAVRHYELLARENRDVAASRLTHRRGGDTEFERLRDFLPDDEFRRIDWRATARRSKLTVREYQLEQNQNLLFLLDCGRLMTAVWDGLTALDHALNATLMLSHVAVRRGDQVGLLAFDEKVTRLLLPRAGTTASNQLIAATYDLFPRMVESDYEAAFRALKLHVRKRTLVVFITHALDEATAQRLEHLTRSLLPQHLPLCVLLQDRELLDRAHRHATTAEDACIQGAAAELLLWRDRVRRQLERAGVLVLEALASELTGALVARYLEVKARGLI
jgi:uncharacterized protein (DUF58 family)